MKKIISLVTLTMFLFSCEKYLDTESYTKKNTGNFPSTVADANQMITGIYSTLSTAISDPQHTHFFMAELASDDRFGGGGENSKNRKALDPLRKTKTSRSKPLRTARHRGADRANTALEHLDGEIAWEGEGRRTRLTG